MGVIMLVNMLAGVTAELSNLWCLDVIFKNRPDRSCCLIDDSTSR